MTHYFANVLYLFICMLGNCSCFYFRLLTFFKIKFLKINHSGPPSECQTVGSRSRSTFCWSSYGFKLFAKSFWQTTKLSTGMQRVITGKNFSAQYIVSYRDIHAYVYHKYWDTLNTFNMLCPLKTYAAISNAHLSRVCKRGKLSGSCLSTFNGFGSTQLPIFLCHIGVPTFSSQNN